MDTLAYPNSITTSQIMPCLCASPVFPSAISKRGHEIATLLLHRVDGREVVLIQSEGEGPLVVVDVLLQAQADSDDSAAHGGLVDHPADLRG
jgi:hypothetical protein